MVLTAPLALFTHIHTRTRNCTFQSQTAGTPAEGGVGRRVSAGRQRTRSDNAGPSGASASARPAVAAAVAAADLPGAMARLRLLAVPYAHMAQYRCREALVALDDLPEEEAASALALRIRGRALYELADYAAAADVFAEALASDPYRLDGVADIYSTCLWQLRRDVELATLAHALQERLPRVRRGP